MGKPKAPAPPDPRETSAAQTGTNVATAIANNSMGLVNQYTPYGSLTYQQTGTHVFTDPYTGKSYEVPMYSSATTLSPAEQAIADLDTSSRTNLAGIASDQSGFLRDYLSTPFQADTSAIEGRLDELYSSRMEPKFARDEETLRTRLVNQGITVGSDAWNREMQAFGQNRNDARVQTMLQGRGQAFNELQTLRNQPINEISALMSNSQVNQPSVSMQTPQMMPTVDNAGLIMQNYGQQMNNYNQRMASQQSLLGGLFGLGAKAISGGLF